MLFLIVSFNKDDTSTYFEITLRRRLMKRHNRTAIIYMYERQNKWVKKSHIILKKELFCLVDVLHWFGWYRSNLALQEEGKSEQISLFFCQPSHCWRGLEITNTSYNKHLKYLINVNVLWTNPSGCYWDIPFPIYPFAIKQFRLKDAVLWDKAIYPAFFINYYSVDGRVHPYISNLLISWVSISSQNRNLIEVQVKAAITQFINL